MMTAAAERAGSIAQLADARQRLARCIAASTSAHYVSHWRRFVESKPADLSLGAITLYVTQLAATCDRPESTVNHFTAALRLVCDCAGWPCPTDDPLFARLKKGTLRIETTQLQEPGPVLDVYKVLRGLRADAIEHNTVSRATVAAGIAATIPSRPSELRTLRHGDVVFVWPDQRQGHADKRVPYDKVNLEIPQVELGTPHASFYAHMTFTDTKTDKTARKGVRKLLQHPDGATWSPALALLAYVQRARIGRFIAEVDLLFSHNAQDVWSEQSYRDDLSRVAVRYTGERVTPKYWRHSAATWLLRCGIDIATVAALGGWVDHRSLTKHYVRSTTIAAPVLLRVVGLADAVQQDIRHDPLHSFPPLEPAVSRVHSATPRQGATPPTPSSTGLRSGLVSYMRRRDEERAAARDDAAARPPKLSTAALLDLARSPSPSAPPSPHHFLLPPLTPARTRCASPSHSFSSSSSPPHLASPSAPLGAALRSRARQALTPRPTRQTRPFPKPPVFVDSPPNTDAGTNVSAATADKPAQPPQQERTQHGRTRPSSPSALLTLP